MRLVMVPVGESRLELAGGDFGRFGDREVHRQARRRAASCLSERSSLPAAVERLKKDGVRLVSEEIKVGAGGHRYVFVHPSSAGGVLLELVEG